MAKGDGLGFLRLICWLIAIGIIVAIFANIHHVQH